MQGVFYNLHPLTSFTYFALVLSFTMIFTHPVCLIISFVCAALYSLYLRGAESFFRSLLFIMPLMFFTAILNPLFNHRGATILTYFPGGNPLTLESLFYGASASLMMGAVIMWFMCFSIIMDSSKIVCLLGRIMPSVSLVITITLRLIPMYLKRMKDAWDIQRCTFGGSTGRFAKVKSVFSVLSSVTSWALESGIETADSMKSRGHGSDNRTSYSIYRFSIRDKLYMTAMFLLGGLFISLAVSGFVSRQYFPTIFFSFSSGSLWAFAALAALCFMPLISEIREGVKWHSLKSKT